MKGYIRRLSQDIKKVEFKRDCIANFLTYRYDEVDQTQAKLMNEQAGLMEQLLVVMNQRLDYEKQIHPDYFEEYDWSKIRIVSLNDFPRDKDCEGTEAGVMHGDKSYTIFYFEDETLAMTDEEAGKLEDPADEE